MAKLRTAKTQHEHCIPTQRLDQTSRSSSSCSLVQGWLQPALEFSSRKAQGELSKGFTVLFQLTPEDRPLILFLRAFTKKVL